MAWLNLIMPNQTVKNGLKAKNIELHQINSFLKKTTNKVFMHLLAPFILQTLKKVLNSQSKVMRMCHFWAQNGPFAPFLGSFALNKKFLVKAIIITLVKTIIYLLALFIV